MKVQEKVFNFIMIKNYVIDFEIFFSCQPAEFFTFKVFIFCFHLFVKISIMHQDRAS